MFSTNQISKKKSLLDCLKLVPTRYEISSFYFHKPFILLYRKITLVIFHLFAQKSSKMSQHHASSPSKSVNHPAKLSLDRVLDVTPLTTIPPLEKKVKKPRSSPAKKSKDDKGNAATATDDRTGEEIVNVDRSIRRLVDIV